MDASPSRAERRAATAARILDAAQAEFGAHGAEGATIRGIARRAGVDPSLVLQHYGSKQGLFALAVRPAADLTAEGVPAHLAEVLEARLTDLSPATKALMRSMLTSAEAAAVMREYLQERTENLARTFSGDDAELRAAAIVSSILGVTIARHFLDLAPLKDADEAQIAALTTTWLSPLT
ncbi:TetR family transcriptional regulator [Leifsonia sp. 1010]|uniref:TetR/AcrR family transcriptional regulator n=1 Tax=Leifsonia sp. 1010 TaxID=2817769 RepID=UPI00285E28F7|nr:TetR family transcriptional regulator [Leifsonia sp. 1010]MDR6612057.1 AcrR family transcriptional regulator [Leifsonia sp. 1010]